MKAYFDNLKFYDSNMIHLTENGDQKYWLVSSGSIIKNRLLEYDITIDTVDNASEQGCYFIDVNGDPEWWSGVLRDTGAPREHIISVIPNHIKKLVRDGLVRIVIAGDKEGGPFVSSKWDCFKAATDAMRVADFPSGSVLILQGNMKIEKQYDEWLIQNNEQRLFEVMYSNTFLKVFIDENIPRSPIVYQSIDNINAKDYNSLNRVFRPHRGAHLYKLVKDKILNNGLVSANQISKLDRTAVYLADTNIIDYGIAITTNFPKFIDGDWANNNAGAQYNIDIYKNSLMTVITETKFNEDTIFPTEKIYKPLMLGHPLILFASAGTLASMRTLGFKTDWCGIDPSYNDIEDDVTRMAATHAVLLDWVRCPRNEKIKKILDSISTIEHNFTLAHTSNFHKDSLLEALNRSERYFND